VIAGHACPQDGARFQIAAAEMLKLVLQVAGPVKLPLLRAEPLAHLDEINHEAGECSGSSNV
jgi:hypothetical protein